MSVSRIIPNVTIVGLKCSNVDFVQAYEEVEDPCS